MKILFSLVPAILVFLVQINSAHAVKVIDLAQLKKRTATLQADCNSLQLESFDTGEAPVEKVYSLTKMALGFRYLQQTTQYQGVVLLRDSEFISLINSNSGRPKLEIGAHAKPTCNQYTLFVENIQAHLDATVETFRTQGIELSSPRSRGDVY